MKTQLSVLPSVNNFIFTDNNADDSLLSSFCRDIKNAHIQLGIQLASEGWTTDSEDILRNAMNTLALLYEQLEEIRKEAIEYTE